MDSRKIEVILLNILEKEFDKDSSIININTTLSTNDENSLDLTSLQIINFIIMVEEAFNIIIDYDVFFNTIGDIVDYIMKLVK